MTRSQAWSDRRFRELNGERHALIDLHFDGVLRARGQKRLAWVTAEMERVEHASPMGRRERRGIERYYAERMAELEQVAARVNALRAEYDLPPVALP